MGVVGHLFQGRFKAILVGRWSSYRASMGLVPAETFLAVDGLLAQFAVRRSVAQTRYAQFVSEGVKAPSPSQQLKGQVFLGDERFVEKIQSRATKHQRQDVQIPVAHRRPPPGTLQQIEKTAADRNAAIAQAHDTGAYSYQQIADHFGIHFTTVGRIVRDAR